MSGKIAYQDKPWIAHYDEGVPATVEYENKTMVDYLEDAARDFPKRTAFICQDYKVTFSEVKDMVDRLATCLTDFGIKKQDSVAIHLGNLIQTVVAYYAILKVGGKVVLNNPLYSPHELEHQFNDSESKVLITLDLLANNMVELRPKTQIKQIIYASFGDYLPPEVDRATVFAAEPNPADDLYKWTDIIAKYEPNPPEVKSEWDDIALLQYTGGTTGVSKGAMLTHGNISAMVQQFSFMDPTISRGDDEIFLGSIPFFHVFGMSASMNMGIFSGFTNVLTIRPQAEYVYEAIKKYRPTVACLVPAQVLVLLSTPEYQDLDYTCLKRINSGSAPLPVEVFNQFAELSGAMISEGYGLTEASPATHANPFDGKKKPGSIGLPNPDVECRIVDLEKGTTDMPVGEAGELIIRGPQIMKGYWKKPDETAATLRDGWLYTGDIGKMDEEGYFYIVDRKKDMILSGGLNVYPRDIDEALYTHPKVLEACAIGIPHPTRGEQIKAFIVLKEGKTATAEEMIEYCGTRLAKYKLPTIIEFRDELPKNNIGKVLRKDLRAQELDK